MKNRYYLSILSLYPSITAYGRFYLILNQSLEILSTVILIHFNKRKLSIGFSPLPLYYKSNSVDGYFPDLDIL